MSDHPAWSALTAHIGELQTLTSVGGLLAWDQQVFLPPGGAANRAEQSALLSRLAHERLTDPRVGAWLEACEAAELDDLQRRAVAQLRRQYDRETRVPTRLVEDLARAEADGFSAWMAAREADDVAPFLPVLERLLNLVRDKAAAIDPDRHPYDVLLEDYDRGTTVASLRPMFARLREGLAELVSAVADAPPVPDLDAPFDLATQEAMHREVAAALGYDFHQGRLDAAEHPFTIGLGPGDVRITTHLYERDLLKGLSGTIHETGHALYEQGLPHQWRGTGLDAAASFGLHESQSRFWENTIGGSLPFFRWFEGVLRRHFPNTDVDAERMYRASNRIQPGLVRIAADEVTYNLHIIVRFELEVALLEGRLAVADLRDAWDDAYATTVGIRPTNARDGVLQDVHWSGGMFAYFPSYTLGNLYAASLGAALEAQVPDLWEEVERGEFETILGWLRANVHEIGDRMDAPEIVRRAVGDRDHVEDLLAALWGRHGALYGVRRPSA